MITLSNGKKIEYVVASGALGFDGRGYFYDQPFIMTSLLDRRLFAITLKTATRFPRKGNRSWKDWLGVGCIRFIDDGTVSSVGLSNPGFDELYYNWRFCNSLPVNDFDFIPSIQMEGVENLTVYMTERLNGLKGVIAIELNASCPNSGEDLHSNSERVVKVAQKVAEVSDYPVILKLSCIHNLEMIARRVAPFISAFSINSVPWNVAFPERTSPVDHLGGGGISGKPAQPYNWEALERLVSAANVPVIAPSIWEYEDIARARSLGAQAFSFGAIHLPCPWRPRTWMRPAWPTRWVRADMKAQEEQKLERARLCPEKYDPVHAN